MTDQTTPDDQLRAYARAVVSRAMRSALYIVDSEGLPSNREQREAYDQAVEAQHNALVAAGVGDALASGGSTAEPMVSSSSNQGASVTFDNSEAAGARARLLDGGLAPYAKAHLDAAGLLHGLPGVRL